MKALCLLLGIILVATARAESLRLILVPQQVMIPPNASSMRFDLYLYNGGNAAEVVPSLEQFRAVYAIRRGSDRDTQYETQMRKFSHPIKNHTLKANRLDHIAMQIDFGSIDGDYIELFIEVGNERTLTSNSVVLLCSPKNAPSDPAPPSPTPALTPK